jgi:hypothetical protein
MRYIVMVIAALIVSSVCHAQGGPQVFISGLGYNSCGKYLAVMTIRLGQAGS